MKPLKTTSVFISGGMSGIGKQLAIKYLERGHNVAIFNRSLNSQAKNELSAKIINESQEISYYQVDVSDYDAIHAAMEDAYRSLGSPQLAINSAGVQKALPFLELSHEDFEHVISVNLTGSRNFAHAAIQFMRPGSQLVLVSSLAGIIPNYTYAAYCASKFGAYGLAKVLRVELKEANIGVSVICPPEVNTPMLAEEKRKSHPASRTLKAFAGTLELDRSVNYIVSKLDKKKFLIIPGLKAKFVYFSDKYLPEKLTFYIVDALVKFSFSKEKRYKL